MTKPRRFGPKGPRVVKDIPALPGPRERVFGGPTPDGPLPGRILVQLSRLHRAEAAQPDSGRDGERG